MTIVENNFGGVPLAGGFDLGFFRISGVHGVVGTGFLPIFQRIGKSEVINQLIFRSGHIGNGKFRMLYHMVQHTAIATFSNFPIPYQLEIIIRLFGNDITMCIGTFSFGLNHAIFGKPGGGQLFTIVIAPSV